MTAMSRRTALHLGALAAAAPATAALATPAAAETAETNAETFAAGVPSSWVVQPFPNDRVTLAPSLFTANRDRILTFLRSYPVDRMLAVFRANAGLDTLGAQPPGGWETADGNLRGHYAGHFLSALALAYAGSGDAVYKNRADAMVARPSPTRRNSRAPWTRSPPTGSGPAG